MLSERSILRKCTLNYLCERVYLLSKQSGWRMLFARLRVLRCWLRTNGHGHDITPAWAEYHHRNELYHSDAPATDLSDHKLNVFDNVDNNLHRQCHPGATANFHRHDHKNNDIFDRSASDMLRGLPFLPCLIGRRLLCYGSCVWLCELPTTNDKYLTIQW